MPKAVSDILPPLMKVIEFAGKETDVLRLREGRIERGAFNGTRMQRFAGWLVKNFRGKKYREDYFQRKSEDYKAISDRESCALALALEKELSRRAPEPYKLEDAVTVERARELLDQSKANRETFHQLVDEVAAPMLTPPELLSDPTHGATSVVDLAVNNQFLQRDVQVHQLRVEVAAKLESHGVNRSEIERLDRVLDDKAIKVSLFATARDYAIRLYAPKAVKLYTPGEGGKDWLGHAEPDDKQLAGWKGKRSLSSKDSREQLKKMSVTDLAIERMIENETTPIHEALRLKGTARKTHIQQLEKIPQSWARRAIQLYDNNNPLDDHKAEIVEREGRKSDARRNLQKKRRKAQDDLGSRNPFKRMGASKRLRDLEKQLEEIDPHLLVKESTNSTVETSHASSHHSNDPTHHSEMVKKEENKLMERRPIVYSDVAMEKKEAIAKTVEAMTTKYPEFQHDHYKYLMDELREYLDRHLSDRTVTVATRNPAMKKGDGGEDQG